MRSPCCNKKGLSKGPWTKKEDQKLIDYVCANGQGCWRSLPRAAELQGCSKSCRLRWINYLKSNDQRGNDFSDEEEDLIIRLHKLLGNRWSLIAGRLPGRTDNEVKNHWNTHMRKKLASVGQVEEPEHSYSTVDDNDTTTKLERDVTYTLPDLNLELASSSPAKPNETETNCDPTLLLFI